MSLKMQYTIGQVAEKSNLSIHTLRYYEKEGILPFIKRNEGGIRIYEEEHIEWLKFICCLRDTGMSISQLKDFVELTVQGDGTTEQRIQMLELQKKTVQEQVNTLMSYIGMIDFKIDMYSKEKDGIKSTGQPGSN
ncbi:DNA-binding transcriptional regulator, MerR family [Paenibacillus sophorae]|uniref:DNA-binding transcriptional regulator, MerR family n=2 Tax=Paenibacillus sophorae TaxID=1333845 RepID=A0A1H8SUE3_9BACL|nr:MerR family transcriptional regulator [Paenibacillus sophorae]SEO82165.1 DNA-binding transcriptional regulator, MerR family [Paenibacillus sophorae]